MTQLDFITRPRDVHANSIKAYSEDRIKLSKRARLILEYLGTLSAAKTDRQIQTGMGYRELGMVQPRITELEDCGMILELGQVVSQNTGKTVRQMAITEKGRREIQR